nr:RecName: Full=Snake venom serine protease homolog; AltName: Full=Serine proteinase-like protein [Crotalus atrox]
FLVALYTFR